MKIHDKQINTKDRKGMGIVGGYACILDVFIKDKTQYHTQCK
jgi:hypothetical protein